MANTLEAEIAECIGRHQQPRCSLGPRNEREGWSDDEAERIWYMVLPHQVVYVMGQPVSSEVCACPEHHALLMAAEAL